MKAISENAEIGIKETFRRATARDWGWVVGCAPRMFITWQIEADVDWQSQVLGLVILTHRSLVQICIKFFLLPHFCRSFAQTDRNYENMSLTVAALVLFVASGRLGL